MRKKYISPMTKEYTIQPTLLTGGSILRNGNNAEVEVNTSEDYDGVFGSRGGAWDDDE